MNGVIAIGKVLQAKQHLAAELLEVLKQKNPDPKVVEALAAKQKPDAKLVQEAVAIFRACLKDTQIILRNQSARAAASNT